MVHGSDGFEQKKIINHHFYMFAVMKLNKPKSRIRDESKSFTCAIVHRSLLLKHKCPF